MSLDTIEESHKKRVGRFIMASDEILNMAAQLEHDLNYFGDYIGSEKLFEAMRHARSAYHIVKKIKEENESENE